MKVLIFIIFVFLLSACTNKNNSANPVDYDYSVYISVLKYMAANYNKYHDNQLERHVINDKIYFDNITDVEISDSMGNKSENSDLLLYHKQKGFLKQVLDSTWYFNQLHNDFNSQKNDTALFNNKRIPTDIKINVLSLSEFNDFWREDPASGWQKFSKKYPNSTGFTTFSHVGYNELKTQSVLFIHNFCGVRCGSGAFIFLKRKNELWNVEKYYPVVEY